MDADGCEDGPGWAAARELPRIPASELRRSRTRIPTARGVYVWFRDGEPVYVGEAKGRAGLRSRLSAHLATSQDLSRSTLRASVAVQLLGVTRSDARARPCRLDPADIAVVSDWLGQCEVGWFECPTAESARALETRLRAEWLPPLNRM